MFVVGFVVFTVFILALFLFFRHFFPGKIAFWLFVG